MTSERSSYAARAAEYEEEARELRAAAVRGELANVAEIAAAAAALDLSAIHLRRIAAKGL